MANKKRRKKKKKNPYLGKEPLSDDLVSKEEIEFREDLLGEYDDDVFGVPGGIEGEEGEAKGVPVPPPVPKNDEPVDDLGLTAADRKVIPPEMLVTLEVEEDEGQHFTLFVSEVTTSVQRRGTVRIPSLKFKVQLAMARYYMVELKEGGTKRPAIDHAPITEPFIMELPISFLPSAIRKYPDMVSPALATKVLNQMMNKYPWSTIKPAPKTDAERLLPDEILKKLKAGMPKGL